MKIWVKQICQNNAPIVIYPFVIEYSIKGRYCAGDFGRKGDWLYLETCFYCKETINHGKIVIFSWLNRWKRGIGNFMQGSPNESGIIFLFLMTGDFLCIQKKMDS